MSSRPTLESIKRISTAEELRGAMSHVFQDAQLSLSGHRKLVVVLKNIFDRSIELNQEEFFALYFTKLINKILPLKKGEKAADRIAKFCSAFVFSLTNDDILRKEEEKKKSQLDENVDENADDNAEDEDNPDEEDTYSTLFIQYLIHHLLRGIEARDKSVRYRVVQLLAYLVHHIGEINRDSFEALYTSLMKRLNDKEPIVRIQAIVAISKFQDFNLDGFEYTSNTRIGSENVRDSLMNSLVTDENAEVRRAALLNLSKDQNTIGAIIERASDTNMINRRLVYSRIVREIGNIGKLDFELRDFLLRWGLNDRDGSVQAAAVKMLSTYWFEAEGKELLNLISQLRVTESDIAATAVFKFFQAQPDELAKIVIDDSYWKELDVNKAFLLRTFYEHCNENNLYDLIDANFPESIELANILEKYLRVRVNNFYMDNATTNAYDLQKEKLEAKYDEHFEEHDQLKEAVYDCEVKHKQLHARYLQLVEETNELNEGFKEKDEFYENDLTDLEFIIEQLLEVAKEFDFSDEIGRRKMLQIIRKSLTEDRLTDKLVSVALKVLRKISINEKDFISMSAEIITDIRDSFETEEEFHSAISGFAEDDDEDEDEDEDEDDDNSKSKKRKVQPRLPPDDIVIRCLIVTQHALELVEEPSDNHVSLGSIYSGLVNYAINCKEKHKLHLLGLTCLGLFSLIDKNTAKDAIETFYYEMRSSGEEVRIIGMKAIVDILSKYGASIIAPSNWFMYARLFYKSLTSFKMPKLQCIVAEGLCKLFLADIFNSTQSPDGSEESSEYESEKQLFEAIILSYFHPLTVNNDELRQILAFCIPVYSFSHPQHQLRLATVSGDCIYRMFNDQSEFVKHQSRLLPSNVVQQLIHWCDPNNLVNLTQFDIKKQTSHVWQSVYMLQAVEQDTPRSVKRAIINNLNKLYLTEELESKVLQGLLDAVEGTRQCFETKANDPEYALDKLNTRNFDSFQHFVQDLFEKAVEREKKEEEKTGRSRSNSILVELDENDYETEKSLVKEEEADASVKDDVNDGEDADHEKADTTEVKSEDENEDQDDEDQTKKDGLNKSLEEIDAMLDEEDEVEYDISMEES
ncbi:condensin complex subunit 3 [Scheffersomyces stipitis CBS 6054]|uniref:Condensin complex subunit 3 n=1 Tax=Scheffersomyces stipitis (strain ATCC 58785 / CBS 6054 / NBRC 10063 / NRRL Y-11545) TaxID=322104 RepID=A3GHB5_PICST|nr:condensin complex subunit 3 [Scheffersomyces stipitis CBS 6054]EAZ62788.2 condensin complex subunit 3 [Scheffersomyces stipitis CBS 6054]